MPLSFLGSGSHSDAVNRDGHFRTTVKADQLSQGESEREGRGAAVRGWSGAQQERLLRGAQTELRRRSWREEACQSRGRRRGDGRNMESSCFRG